ncbi:MAG: class F sortase [Chloroflexi bacterium]|nr:class F sortase [Chloroflexota bacterium]
MHKRNIVVDRFWLIAAIAGLSVTTVVVLLVAGFYVASLVMRWQPEPDPEPIAAMILQPETAVSTEPETAVVVSLKEPIQERVLSGELHETTPQVILSDQFAVTQNEQLSTLLTEEETAQNTLGQLIIPTLDINRTITSVPLQNGQWDIAGLSQDIGHLTSTGAYPGDDLAMAFIGHVTVPWPGTAPFAELIFLEHGEEVIYRWNDTDYIYKVERIFRAHPSNVDLLYESDGSTINLVTCSGWDFIDREYDERLVTRAVLVRQEPSPQTLEQ